MILKVREHSDILFELAPAAFDAIHTEKFYKN